MKAQIAIFKQPTLNDISEQTTKIRDCPENFQMESLQFMNAYNRGQAQRQTAGSSGFKM
jgi:hypothetical protein